MEQSKQLSKVLAGRVIGILDGEGPMDQLRGFVLQNESGRYDIETENFPAIGDIVEAHVDQTKKGNWRLNVIKVLVKNESDFYIAPSSPNYKKIIIDLSLKEKLIQRTKIIQKIREFFLEKDFVETDTPELVNLPGMEPYLDVFKTKFSQNFDASGLQEKDLYLITSPEYAMKKLLVGGFEKIFQLTKAFRNKETSGPQHNPEFTILEWYRAYSDYEAIMDDTENLVKFLFKEFAENAPKLIEVAGVNIEAKWRRLKVVEAFEEFAGITCEQFEDLEKFRGAVAAKGYKVDSETSFDDMFFIVFLNEIERKLGFGAPVLLYEYPLSMAALSKVCSDNPKYAQRFEAYIGGVELCNGFTELNDAREQEARLKVEREERKKLGKEIYDVDKSFIEALELGMPPSGGNALGVDRLIMLLTNTQNIEDILFFPYKDL